MKTLFIALLLPFLLLASASAQLQPAPAKFPAAGELLPDNVTVALIMSGVDQEKTELMFVTSSKDFTANINNPKIDFQGQIDQQPDGSIVVRYQISKKVPIRALVQAAPNQITSTETEVVGVDTELIRGAIKLKPGQPALIFKSPSHTYQMSVTPFPMK